MRERQSKSTKHSSTPGSTSRSAKAKSSEASHSLGDFRPTPLPNPQSSRPPQTPPNQAFMRERAVSRGVVSRSSWSAARWKIRRQDRRLGDRLFKSSQVVVVLGWWGTRLLPAPAPMGGKAVRCLGIHPPRTMWLAWSATATATTGLIHIRRPAPQVGSCLIASSQPSPCPNLTPPPSSSGSHRHASHRTPR